LVVSPKSFGRLSTSLSSKHLSIYKEAVFVPDMPPPRHNLSQAFCTSCTAVGGVISCIPPIKMLYSSDPPVIAALLPLQTTRNSRMLVTTSSIHADDCATQTAAVLIACTVASSVLNIPVPISCCSECVWAIILDAMHLSLCAWRFRMSGNAPYYCRRNARSSASATRVTSLPRLLVDVIPCFQIS
jgi:hypothetical protein